MGNEIVWSFWRKAVFSADEVQVVNDGFHA